MVSIFTFWFLFPPLAVAPECSYVQLRRFLSPLSKSYPGHRLRGFRKKIPLQEDRFSDHQIPNISVRLMCVEIIVLQSMPKILEDI